MLQYQHALDMMAEKSPSWFGCLAVKYCNLVVPNILVKMEAAHEKYKKRNTTKGHPSNMRDSMGQYGVRMMLCSSILGKQRQIKKVSETLIIDSISMII